MFFPGIAILGEVLVERHREDAFYFKKPRYETEVLVERKPSWLTK